MSATPPQLRSFSRDLLFKKPPWGVSRQLDSTSAPTAEQSKVKGICTAQRPRALNRLRTAAPVSLALRMPDPAPIEFVTRLFKEDFRGSAFSGDFSLSLFHMPPFHAPLGLTGPSPPQRAAQLVLFLLLGSSQVSPVSIVPLHSSAQCLPPRLASFFAPLPLALFCAFLIYSW